MARNVLMLDMQDDEDLIAQYEAHHRAVWPEVKANLAAQGVVSMEIYRLGTRLCMIMETDDERFDAAAMAASLDNDPRLRAWENLMWRFQKPTPWTPAGEKWTAAKRIFDWTR